MDSTPKRRKRKYKFQRRVTAEEIQILKFLWRWKLANQETLRVALFPKMPTWTFYHKIRRLKIEGYVSVGGRGELYEPDVFFLTKKGYELILCELSELKEKRFLPQSIPHDAFVLAFHLGDFIHQKPDHVYLCTEHQFRCFDQSLLPDWLPTSMDHIPDGFTHVAPDGENAKTFAIEVEIHLKPLNRYGPVATDYDFEKKVDYVLWLCRSRYMAHKISVELNKNTSERVGVHNYILFDDFVKLGWGARIIHGGLKDKAVRELFVANAQQSPANVLPSTTQIEPMTIFLSKSKSPKSSKV